MGENGSGIGQVPALFAVAFFLGYLIAEQHHAAEAQRLRTAVKTAQHHTLHLMQLQTRGRRDDES